MKVNDTPLSNTAASRLGAAAHAEGQRTPRRGEVEVPGQDSVQLSALASRLAALVESESPARTERLGRLAALVSSGNYRPDAAAVAKSIVNEALISEP